MSLPAGQDPAEVLRYAEQLERMADDEQRLEAHSGWNAGEDRRVATLLRELLREVERLREALVAAERRALRTPIDHERDAALGGEKPHV